VYKPLILRKEGKTIQKKVGKIHLRVKERKFFSKERHRKMHLSKKERKLHAKIVPKRVTVKLTVGSFIPK